MQYKIYFHLQKMKKNQFLKNNKIKEKNLMKMYKSRVKDKNFRINGLIIKMDCKILTHSCPRQLPCTANFSMNNNWKVTMIKNLSLIIKMKVSITIIWRKQYRIIMMNSNLNIRKNYMIITMIIIKWFMIKMKWPLIFKDKTMI